jgi:tRNA pseudouridine55 synthase
VRKGSGVKKVGHAGTLDPRASGVLVLCLGSATRLSEYLSTSSKRYEALIRLGRATQTYDTEGVTTSTTEKLPNLEQIEAVLPRFTGEIQQVPPPYSAIKVAGKRAYELARAGKDVNLEPRTVRILDLTVQSYAPPDLTVSIECSAGTYIRSLAHDIGEVLKVGGHLAALRRVEAGIFTLEDAVDLASLEQSFQDETWEKYLRPAVDALPTLPPVEINDASISLIRNGQRIPAPPDSQGVAKGIDQKGELVAILEAVEDGQWWHPRKVFVR